jgi:hypothetical protein
MGAYRIAWAGVNHLRLQVSANMRQQKKCEKRCLYVRTVNYFGSIRNVAAAALR